MKAERIELSVLPARVLTREGVFTDDAWPVIEAGREVDGSEPGLLPLSDYLAQPQPATHGVWLGPTDDPAVLEPYLAALPLIAVRFEKFADGRGYSIAALLRRMGYGGDLRAIGEVLVDQLHMLRRVGFSSFALRPDQPEDRARAGLKRYSDAYQAAHDQPLPAYRRPPRAETIA